MAWLCLGEGAHCSVLLKYLRPSKAVEDAIVNPVAGQQLDDLITVRCEVTTRRGKTFVSIFYRSDTIPGLLSSAKRWATVIEAGTGEMWGGEPEATATAAATLLSPQPLSRTSPSRTSFSTPKIAQKILPSFGQWVSRSTATTNPPRRIYQRLTCLRLGGGLREGQDWGWDGIDQWASLGGAMYNNPSFADG